MMRIALTHDVDRIRKHYQYITHAIKCLVKKDLRGCLYHLGSTFESEPYWSFPTIIKIEKEYNVKSTFFFMNETIKFDLFDKLNWKLSLGRYSLVNPKIVKMIKYLDENGWEIGLHGSYNSYNNYQLLKSEKEILENIHKHDVNGIRQHYLKLDSKTWEIQKSLGFRYDSTFGYTDNIGFKEEKYMPFRPFNDSFTVFPLVIMDDCIMSKPDKFAEFLRLADIAEKENGILVINWHQRDFNEKEFPNHSKFYIKMIEEGKKRNASFRTLIEYYNESKLLISS